MKLFCIIVTHFLHLTIVKLAELIVAFHEPLFWRFVNARTWSDTSLQLIQKSSMAKIYSKIWGTHVAKECSPILHHLGQKKKTSRKQKLVSLFQAKMMRPSEPRES